MNGNLVCAVPTVATDRTLEVRVDRDMVVVHLPELPPITVYLSAEQSEILETALRVGRQRIRRQAGRDA